MDIVISITAVAGLLSAIFGFASAVRVERDGAELHDVYGPWLDARAAADDAASAGVADRP
jgi:hypothetical protein